MSAAGAGVGYAIKQGAEEGAEAIKDKVNDMRAALTSDKPETRSDLSLPPDQFASDSAEDEPVDPLADAAGISAICDRIHELSSSEREDLLASLSEEDRRALAELVRNG